VEELVWRPGDCRVRLQSGEVLTAPRVVITVPLGVLQAGCLRIIPEPPEVREAIHALRFGQAIRVVLRFERPFWQDDPRFAGTGFLLSDEPVFPTWWSTLPNTEPILTAWSAGPRAAPLESLSLSARIERALTSLRRITGAEPPRVVAAWHHDWHADPFSRGAYSWVPAGALPARERLSQPIEDTVYFAGEAIDLAGYGGTVHGAIASGRRVAGLIRRT
jgi:monoamine oxidase